MPRLKPLTALCGLLFAAPMLGHAACPAVGQPVIVAKDGSVNVTMMTPENPGAQYTSILYLNGDPVYGGTTSIFESHPLNKSQTTPTGTTINLGNNFKAGDELVFRLEATDASTLRKYVFYSGDQSRNATPEADGAIGLPHAALSTSATGDIEVRFEDAPGNGECPDGTGAFTDFVFSIDNVAIVLSPDRFLSYKTKPTKMVTAVNLTLNDKIGPFTASISKRASMANPVKIGQTEIVSPDPSLVGYSLAKPLKRKARFGVVNELGSWTVNTKKLDRILVPSSADKSTVPSAPELTNQGVIDTYACYTTKVKGKKNLKSVKKLQDELNSKLQNYTVTTPSHFCAPAGSNGADAKRPDTYLMCYTVTPSGKPAGTVNIANAQETGQVKALKADEYCVPSTATRQ